MHYEREAAGSHERVSEAARKMIQLIERLEETFRDRSVWGLTSIYNLKLLAADDWKTPWFVSIAPPVGGSFVIEYLIPEVQAPWLKARARVVGESKSIDAAVDMIIRAMEGSEGWKTL